jgi:hypothetical protein
MAVVGCGMTSCTGGSSCCVHGRFSEPIECVPANGTCAGQFAARLYCDDTSDCQTGQICCMQFEDIFGAGSSCVTSSACPSDAQHGRMCDPGMPGECGGGACVPLKTVHPTYGFRLSVHVCQP